MRGGNSGGVVGLLRSCYSISPTELLWQRDVRVVNHLIQGRSIIL
jgi:hypothetical protein